MKPGILVHRQSKEMLNTYWKDKEDMEGKIKEKPDFEGVKKKHLKVMGFPPRTGSLESV